MERQRREATAELAALRRRLTGESRDRGAAAEEVALWEGRCAGLQARVLFVASVF